MRALVQTISKIKDPLKQSFFIKDVAEKYKLYESALITELEKFTRKVPERFLAVHRADGGVATVARDAKNIAAIMEQQEIPVEEKELLLVALEEPMQMIPFIFSYIRPEEFSHPLAKEVAEILIDEFDSKGKVDVHQLLPRASTDAVRKLISELSFTPYQLGSRWEKVGARLETRTSDRAEGAIKRLKKKVLEQELAENQRHMKDASLNGEETVQFLQRHQEIFKSLKEIDQAQLKKPSAA